MKNNGVFVISLDFELYWGIRDKRPLPTVEEYLQNTHKIFPRMLAMFRKYEVKTTFAVVGLLAADSKEEMRQYIPSSQPKYSDSNLSPYTDGMIAVKESPEEDPYHFAGNLLQLLQEYPEHELGTHTFSHYYCLEEGASPESFKADLLAAKSIADNKGLAMDSLVFPRNQYNAAFMKICEEVGIKTYRGNERVWFCNPKPAGIIKLPTKIVRTLDSYINISGNHCYDLKELANGSPVDIPSSRFLRPYKPMGGSFSERLKLRRIKKGMTEAAKTGKLYHLWWHPHNFALNSEQNFKTFEAILQHYSELNTKYSFESRTMGEVGEMLVAKKNQIKIKI
jgi:peptidoglycan/xylan/chitin deacetylase (PgdA/CDA1 family)